MSEDRGTHTIITPINGIPVVCRDWINGREKQKIDGAMFGGFRTELDQDGKPQPKMTETMMASQENAIIECIVVSVDGNEIGVRDRVLDMRVKDFEFVVKHVTKIAEGDFDPKDETSSERNTGTSSPTKEADELLTTSSI